MPRYAEKNPPAEPYHLDFALPASTANLADSLLLLDDTITKELGPAKTVFIQAPRPSSANPATLERDSYTAAKGMHLASLPLSHRIRPKTASQTRAEVLKKRTESDLRIASGPKKTHPYKLNKKPSPSLKQSIYNSTYERSRKSSLTRSQPPPPTSLIPPSILACPAFLALAKKSIPDVAKKNHALTKHLARPTIAGDWMPLSIDFNTKPEGTKSRFVDVAGILKTEDERVKDLKNQRKAKQRVTTVHNPTPATATHARTRSASIVENDLVPHGNHHKPQSMLQSALSPGRSRTSSMGFGDVGIAPASPHWKKPSTPGKPGTPATPQISQSLDFMSAEVDLQRNLIHTAKTLGTRHTLFHQARKKLLQIYDMQHAEKLDLYVDLKNDPAGHVKIVEPLVAHADVVKNMEDTHTNSEFYANQIIFLRTKARSLAEKTRDALRIRAKLSHWNLLEKKLTDISALSHDMSEGVVSEYHALTGITHLADMGHSEFDEEAAIKKHKMKVESAMKISMTFGTDVLLDEVDEEYLDEDCFVKGEKDAEEPLFSDILHTVAWGTSNKLDVYHGDNFHVNETPIDSLSRVGRKEFGLAARGAMNRLAKGDCDKTDEHLFRASLGQLKQHPRMHDFLANVVMDVPESFIIGEDFEMRYEYKHKWEPERQHAPSDWIGIFKVDTDADEFKPKSFFAAVSSEEIATRETSSLVCWCEIPYNSNAGRLFVERMLIKEERPYRAMYFVNGSTKPLASSTTFYPYFFGASVSVIGPTHLRDRNQVKPVDRSCVKIVCGVSIDIKFSVGHSDSHLHCPKDTIGLVRDATGPNSPPETVRSFPVPPDSNSGTFTIEFGLLEPGNYHLCYFAYEHNNRVCGESEQIMAVMDFGKIAEEHAKHIKNRQFRVYFATRWDMETERETWKNIIVPRMRKLADDHFIDFSYVDVTAEKTDPTQLQSGELLSKMLWGIRYCSPVFVACFGEMKGLNLKHDQTTNSQKEDIITRHPWTHSFLNNSESAISITDLELQEALFIPLMEKYSSFQSEHFHCFVRHPSMRSVNFPDHMKHLKGVNTITNIKNKKSELRDLLAKIADTGIQLPPKYVTAEELTDSILPVLQHSMEKMWNSNTMPGGLDRLGIETEVGIDKIRECKVRGLDKSVYACTSDDNSVAKFFRPVNETVGNTSMPARARALLESRKILPKTMYEICEFHCDSLNNEFLVVVDSPYSGLTSKITSFLKGYISTHEARRHLPQWGDCTARAVIDRHFKTVTVNLGGDKTELMVKTKANVGKASTCRQCLLLYLDLKRPSQRWKLDNTLKYIMHEIKRTFKIDDEMPKLESDYSAKLAIWLSLIATKGDAVLIFDGVDFIDHPKEDDPFFWLPKTIPPVIRIIFTCNSSSRMFSAVNNNGNERECKVIKKKCILSEEQKKLLIDGIAKHLGFAIHVNSLGLLLSSEKTCCPGYLKFVVEEMFFRGMFENAGVYNEDKRWGVWDLPDLDICGGKKIRDMLYNFTKELLEVETVKLLYKKRMLRLIAEVPFFETAICCIRLARKGLGEDELRRIMISKRATQIEGRRAEGHKREDGTLEGGKGSLTLEASMEGEGSGTVMRKLSPEASFLESKISEQSSVEAEPIPAALGGGEQETAGKRKVAFQSNEWIALQPRLMELCMNCLGKYTLGHMDCLYMLDQIMEEKHIKAEEQKRKMAGEAAEAVAGGKSKKQEAESNRNLWKGVYLNMTIEMFFNCQVSFRKAEELPFLVKYYTKTFNQVREKKLVMKWRDRLLKLVLDIEMFCKMTSDMLIDDLQSCLSFCQSDPTTTAILIRANFESYFGLRLRKAVGGKYELLTQKEVEKVDFEDFRMLGSKYLFEMAKFVFDKLKLASEAQEMCESCLLLLYGGKGFPAGRAKLKVGMNGWDVMPLNLACAVQCVELLSGIYLKRIEFYHAQAMKGRGGRKRAIQRKTEHVMSASVALDGVMGFTKDKELLGAIQRIRTEKGITGDTPDAVLGAGGASFDVVEMKFKLDYLSLQNRALEDHLVQSFELDDSLIEILERFDRNEERFDDIFDALPQKSAYRRRIERNTWKQDQLHSGDLMAFAGQAAKEVGAMFD